MFRIVGGAASGCRIAIPRVAQVKPAPERVRESVFSILDDRSTLQDAVVLDLFAGSAVMGLEAVSRGASFCTFVENNRQALKVIRRNVQAVGFPRRCRVLRCDLLSDPREYAGRLPIEKRASLIFFDPPFVLFSDKNGRSRMKRLLTRLAVTCFEHQAWIVMRHEDKNHREAEDVIQDLGWRLSVKREYGRSCVRMMQAETP